MIDGVTFALSLLAVTLWRNMLRSPRTVAVRASRYSR